MASDLPSPLRLAVTALLLERPRHAYALALEMRCRGLDGFGVNPGALHHALAGLLEMGWIAPAGKERQGRRAERSLYRATELGRAQLLDGVGDLLALTRPGGDRFLAGLSLLQLLPAEQAARLLRDRAWALQRELRAGRERYRSLLGRGVSRLSLLDLDYTLQRREGELVWLRRLVDEMSAGELPWISGLRTDLAAANRTSSRAARAQASPVTLEPEPGRATLVARRGPAR